MDVARYNHIDPPLDDSYWDVSTRPLTSLVFIAPMLVLYEAGVLLLPHGTPRNGADVWLRALLGWIGIGQYFLLPVAVCGILLAWHHLRRDPWTVSRRVLALMLTESLILAVVLLVIAQAQGRLLGLATFATSAPLAALGNLPGKMIAYLGAGIYEELLFRLMLLPVAFAALKTLGLSTRASVIAGVIIVSLLFSAAHYRLNLAIGPWQLVTHVGDAWNLRTFIFRFIAGVFFSILFYLRGFGIAAGSHALYDIATVFL
jgi:membrane protease YdiL (CAAX protease family)